MPRVQGKRIKVITAREYEAARVLSGWLAPADVKSYKARKG